MCSNIVSRQPCVLQQVPEVGRDVAVGAVAVFEPGPLENSRHHHQQIRLDRKQSGRKSAEPCQAMLVGIEVVKPWLKAIYVPDQQVKLGRKKGAGGGRCAQRESAAPGGYPCGQVE